MDFNKFDSKKAGAAGAWLHLTSAVDDTLLYADDKNTLPCRVKLMGSEAPEAQAVMRQLQLARAKAAPLPVKDAKGRVAPVKETPKSMDELHAELVELARPMIMDFENIDNGDRPATKDDADWFLNLQITNGQPDERSFAEQCVAFAFKRSSMLGNVSKD